jgi:predicted outer membrane repeat protein
MSTITNSIFSGNFAHGNGGGIYNHMAFETLTGNCTFSGNSAGTYGGAICTLHSLEPAITNCIFYEDSASFGNELAFVLYTYNTNIAYCNISNTPADIYLGPDCTLNWLPGNIDADPRFIKQGYWDPNGTPADANDDIWINGDYHLMPASPCINAGDPNYVPEPNETDLDGNPRIKDGRIDMGAYETIQHEAHLWIYPRMINRRSFQPRIMAWMRLPQGITKEQVDEDEPLILYPGGIKATRQFVIQSRGRFDRCAYVFAFFDKAELMDAIPENGQVELQALGCLLEPGQYFYGNDTVRITAPWPRRRWPYYYWYW